MTHGMRIGLATLGLVVLAAFVGCAGEKPASRTEAPPASGPQRYEIAVGTEGFTPATVRARQGEAVTLVFTRATDETCAMEVVIPAHNVRAALPLHEAVEVTVTPEGSGEIAFGCGMEMMLSGKIVVD